MNGLDRWDLVLLGVAGLAAVWRLVRLMRLRRDQLVAEVQQQVNRQRANKKPEQDEKKQSAA